VHGPLATAAAVMLVLAGIAGYQSYCVNKQCALVMAAEREHENIVAGARTILASTTDPAELTKFVNRRIVKFAGLPNFSQCHLRPFNCGPVQLEDLPEGMFVSFVDCQCQGQTVTLMVIDTSTMATARAPSGVAMPHGIIAATHADHRVLSWHSTKDGLLYILVTSLPLNDALEIAELAQK